MEWWKKVRKGKNPFKNKASSSKEPLLKRNDSARGSSKRRASRVVTKPVEQQKYSGDAALLIVNSKYKKEWGPLTGVLEDGKNVEEMLKKCGYEVEVAMDEEDIPKVVEDFCRKHTNKKRLHVHYSGHGLHNANVEVDGVERNWWKMTQCYLTATPSGDCMVSISGALISVHDLKHMLLKSNPERVTIMLDMCRDLKRDNRGKSKDSVKLRNEKEISLTDHKKIAMIYGTCDLHTAMDKNSFTRELYANVKNNGWYMPILDITERVNKAWEDNGIEQLCTEAIVKVGDNWKNYMWPASPTIPNKIDNAGPQLVEVTTSTSIDQPIEIKPQTDESTEQRLVQLIDRVSRGEQERQKLQEENSDLKSKVSSMESDVSGMTRRKLPKLILPQGDMENRKPPLLAARRNLENLNISKTCPETWM